MERSTALGLGYAGLIPFAGLAILTIFGPDAIQAKAQAALLAWAAVIASFLGGITWGTALANASGRLYFLSIVPFTAAWVALLLPAKSGFWMLIMAFGIALINDEAVFRAGLIPAWFSRLRKRLSILVIVILALTAILA